MRPVVLVLKGGWSSEREVSLASGLAVEDALKEAGYGVHVIDVTRDITGLIASINKSVADSKDTCVVFNTLHGTGGEDGVIQGVLDALNVPYIGSGVAASAVAMDKNLSRIIFENAGIRVPKGVVMCAKDIVKTPPFPVPYVIKPISEGSSVGVQCILEPDTAPNMTKINANSNTPMLVEEYIAGRELAVPVLGTTVQDCVTFPIVEINLAKGFYDYHAKYSDDAPTTYTCPAVLPEEIAEEIRALAIKAHCALGCTGLSRADFRLDDRNTPWILETNTQPGMTSHSLCPLSAKASGLRFSAFIDQVVQSCGYTSKTV